MSNPLVGLFSPATRKALYVIFSLATLAVGAVMAYCGASDLAQPDWVDGANAVLVYVGLGLGLTAASNVPTPDTDEPGGGEQGAVSLLEACAVVVAVIAVLWAVDVIR
jgi:hypothetical protein